MEVSTLPISFVPMQTIARAVSLVIMLLAFRSICSDRSVAVMPLSPLLMEPNFGNSVL